MATVPASKARKKAKQKGKPLSTAQVQKKRRELIGRAADLVIEVHRGALKELELY